MTYDCADLNKCQNEAQCFQDNPTCPTKIMCVCRECFYGTQCQFQTQQFGLSLDEILSYQIRSYVPITRQRIYAKISIAVASIMLTVGFISGTLSISTFQWRAYQKVVCGIYHRSHRFWLYFCIEFQIVVSHSCTSINHYFSTFSHV
ncbi:unnamed protein product [Rotaria socialis]|nr:unnamed protein product [Rotaria socialis]CAF3463006.1 unnamed protein product [Rotaria socialis]CAF3481124.1 unnamed protein product [Rotaria socialis]CAF4602910.1 unnamed protein product [Rotaria socialis]